MPTDGQDFPKRKKCYGTTYSLARDGAPMSDVAEHLVAGLARDLSSNPVPWLRQGIECIIDHSQSLLSYDQNILWASLNKISGENKNSNCVMAQMALLRIGGQLNKEAQCADYSHVVSLLASRFVQAKAIDHQLPEYLCHHQKRAVSEITSVGDELKSLSQSAMESLIKIACETPSGRPPKSFHSPGEALPEIDSNSADSLTSSIIG